MSELRIPNSTVNYIASTAAEMEEEVNWIFRNRASLTIEGSNEVMLRKAIERLDYMRRTLRESIAKEPAQTVTLMAAE